MFSFFLIVIGVFLCNNIQFATSVLIGGIILPHGDFSYDPTLFPSSSTRSFEIASAAREAGRILHRWNPDVILLSTPHGIMLPEEYGVYLARRGNGTAEIGKDLYNSTGKLYNISIEIELDKDLSMNLLSYLEKENLNVEGISPASTGISASSSSTTSTFTKESDELPMPLQWGEIIPLSMLPSPHEYQYIIFSHPRKRYDHAPEMTQELVEIGSYIASWAHGRPERIAVIISGDLSHPYGYSSSSKIFDDAVGMWAMDPYECENDLLGVARGLQNRAMSCGFTGFVLWHGILMGTRRMGVLHTPPSSHILEKWKRENRFDSNVLANLNVTYYGMMAATFAPMCMARTQNTLNLRENHVCKSLKAISNMKISLVDLQTVVGPNEEDAGFPSTPAFSSPPDSDDEFVMGPICNKASCFYIPCLDESIISKDYHISERGEDGDYPPESSFNFFRLQYLIVYMAIMLADGLQGTHLYVLYEGYGYSVASLYCLGFVSGAFSSPFIGAFVDKFGRKRAAALYCVLEMIINQMEQHPMLIGLIAARVIGGVTTNILSSCFEAWLVTEHRKRKFHEESLELLMRDSSIISNSAAIFSGFLAHALAQFLGPVGPFQGAVATTSIALTLVLSIWTENYGSGGNGEVETSIFSHMRGAFETIKNDNRILRIGVTQGLAEGALQTFVFLWSPALRTFASHAPSTALGIDSQGEPAYGLIFGSFMASAVFGGFIAPIMRKIVSSVLCHGDGILAGQGLDPVPVSVMTSLCYGTGSILLFVPCMLKEDSNLSFSVCLAAFVLFEFFVGIYVPSEGVLRSIYMPSEGMCSTINTLRILTNVAVALGVFSTKFIDLKTSFFGLSSMLLIASLMQLSLVSEKELRSMYNKIGFHHSDVLNSAFVMVALVEVAYMFLFE